MPESDVHANLVASLLSHLAWAEGEVTHVAGHPAYQDPPRIGRHKPDVYIVLPTGGVIIGEAKVGTDLDDEASREQFVAFSGHRDDRGERAAFWLCVPRGWRETALAAIVNAGGEVHYRVDVLEVALPNASLPPQPATPS